MFDTWIVSSLWCNFMPFVWWCTVRVFMILEPKKLWLNQTQLTTWFWLLFLVLLFAFALWNDKFKNHLFSILCHGVCFRFSLNVRLDFLASHLICFHLDKYSMYTTKSLSTKCPKIQPLFHETNGGSTVLLFRNIYLLAR